MSTSTTGTGTITLGSALSTGYQTFAQAGITNGQTVRYAIEDGTNFEIGSGVITPLAAQRLPVLLRKALILTALLS